MDQSLGRLLAQQIKNLPAKQEIEEMCVQSLGQKGPLEKEVATHSRNLAWRNPWTEEPGGLQSLGSPKSDRTFLREES